MAASAITLPSCPPVVPVPGLGGHTEGRAQVPLLQSHLGAPMGPLHLPRPRVLHLSVSKRQRGPRHPKPVAPSLRPTLWGSPTQTAPRCPPFPSEARPDPPRGQMRGCMSHLLSAHRFGPQVKPSQVPEACVLGCGSVLRVRSWGSPRLCPLQGERH